MTAFSVARALVAKHGERGVELAENRLMHWGILERMRPHDKRVWLHADFWRRCAYRAFVLHHASILRGVES